MALHEPLEIAFATPRALRFRPPLSSVLPITDAVALIGASAVLGFHPFGLAYVALTFLMLNSDSTRIFRINPRLGDDAGWLVGRLAFSSLVLLSVGAIGVFPSDMNRIYLEQMAIIGPVGAAAVFVGRGVAYGIGRTARARGLTSERTLIVGDGQLARWLAETLEQHQEYGLKPVGFLGVPRDQAQSLPVLGESRDLERVVHEHDVRRVLVAFGDTDDRELVTMLRANERVPAEIHVIPRFFELSGIPQGAAVDEVFGIPLFHLRRPALRSTARLAKRAFDVVVASLLLILTFPFLASVALAVRVSSPGPVLFRQKRVGLNGKIFEIVKFRTMYVNDGSDTDWFVADSDRVTRVGHILRRTSMDELPQLLNVIRGEMSLVGPRPERPHYTDQFAATVSRYDDRHRVLGGITGWAQIHGRTRGLDTVPDRARLDNYYIENWSLWRDLVIVARTIGVLFRGDR